MIDDCFYHHLQSIFSAKSYILYCAGPKLTVPRSSGLDSISLGTVEASLRARQESKFRALIHTKTCGIPRLGHRLTVEQGSAEGTEKIRSQKQESTLQTELDDYRGVTVCPERPHSSKSVGLKRSQSFVAIFQQWKVHGVIARLVSIL